MHFIKTAFAAACLSVAGLGAAAAPIVYGAESYVGDPATNHSIWFNLGLGAGIGKRFDFIPRGTFTTDGATDGRLQGTVLSKKDPTFGFEVDFLYDNDFGGVSPLYKVEQGAATEPGDNFFLNLVSGTLKGLAGTSLEDLTLSVSARPVDFTYATQVGTGSNAKNPGIYGLANWFFVDVAKFDCLICTDAAGGLKQSNLDARYGDVNIILTTLPGVSQVPLPAGGLLILTGVGALALARRRRKAA